MDINPTIQNISYDIADLYNFIDGTVDISALVWVSFFKTLTSPYSNVLFRAM